MTEVQGRFLLHRNADGSVDVEATFLAGATDYDLGVLSEKLDSDRFKTHPDPADAKGIIRVLCVETTTARYDALYVADRPDGYMILRMVDCGHLCEADVEWARDEWGRMCGGSSV